MGDRTTSRKCHPTARPQTGGQQGGGIAHERLLARVEPRGRCYAAHPHHGAPSLLRSLGSAQSARFAERIETNLLAAEQKYGLRAAHRPSLRQRRISTPVARNSLAAKYAIIEYNSRTGRGGKQ